MGLFKKFVSQTRKPEGFLGKVMLSGMNSGHAAMAGGLIPRDRFEQLGRYPDDTLRNAFLNALDEQMKE